MTEVGAPVAASRIAEGAELERVSTGATWAEGPVWLPHERVVLWSDIPGDRILRYSPSTGETTVHRERVEHTNGRTLDLDGRIIQCSHGRRAVEREVDGVPRTLVDRYGDARFNSPNDVVVRSDGTIWFTDPTYGIMQPGEGHPGSEEYGGRFVFRFDPATGELDPVVTDLEQPNGLAFSADESVLYISDTSASDPGMVEGAGNRHITAYDVVDGRSCTNPRVFASARSGVVDGFRVDENGCLWLSSADAVEIVDPEGALLESIPVPEVVSNLCFGGEDGRDLYITATTSLYRIRTTVRVAGRP